MYRLQKQPNNWIVIMERNEFFVKKYISCEGCIGVGKTTLTNAILEHLEKSVNTKPIFEIVNENPFLEKFYEDPEHWGFQTESYFLINRYMQLKKVKNMIENGNTVVSDYHILKNLIFAELNLKGDELKKYRKLYNTMIDGFKLPDIIIYSDIGIEEVVRRINLRGREMEKDISKDYLQKLIDMYKSVMDLEKLEYHYPGTQLIKVDADKVNFFKNPVKFDELFRLVDNALKDENIKFQELE